MREQQTLGRRIQEGRKAAGLSQESLGERLGVSRQAVSKWEADTSVPELENLIAMSRIFGVTIGALLGVEPEAAEGRSEEDAPEAPGQAAEDTAPDGELAAVEAIVQKYLEAARRPRWSRRRKILAGAAVCGVLVLAVYALGTSFSILGDRLDLVQGQVYGIESSVSSQIGMLTGQIRDILDADSNLFSTSQAQVTDYDLTAETVTLQISAQAKSWQADTTAVFTALLSDGRQFSAEAAGGDGIFTVRDWVLPMDQEIALSGTLTAGGAASASPLETLYDCLPENFRLDVQGDFRQTSWSSQWTDFQDGSWPQTSKELTLEGLSLSISSFGGDSHSGPAPTEVELCFFRGQETVPESSVPIPEALELWQETGFVEMQNWTDYGITCRLLPEETLTAAVRITDDHGQTTWTILCAYRLDRSGNVQTLMEPPDNWQPGGSLNAAVWHS